MWGGEEDMVGRGRGDGGKMKVGRGDGGKMKVGRGDGGKMKVGRGKRRWSRGSCFLTFSALM